MPNAHQENLLSLFRQPSPIETIFEPALSQELDYTLSSIDRPSYLAGQDVIIESYVRAQQEYCNDIATSHYQLHVAEQALAQVCENTIPFIRRKLDQLKQAGNTARCVCFPDIRQLAILRKHTSMTDAHLELSHRLELGTTGLVTGVVPVYLDSQRSLVACQFIVNTDSGNAAAIADLGSLWKRLLSPAVECPSIHTSTRGSCAQESLLRAQVKARRSGKLTVKPPKRTRYWAIFNKEEVRKEARSRMLSLPRRLRVTIELLALGFQPGWKAHGPSITAANQQRGSCISDQPTTNRSGLATAPSTPDSFLRMTAAEKRAFYARPDLNRISASYNTSTASHVDKQQDPTSVSGQSTKKHATLYPMNLDHFTRYCASAEPCMGHTCLWLQLFDPHEADWESKPDVPGRYKMSAVLTDKAHLMGGGPFDPFIDGTTVLERWTGAMLSLPSFVDSVHIEAIAPPGIDLAEVRMICNRLMTVAMFRTRHSTSKIAVTWDIATRQS